MSVRSPLLVLAVLAFAGGESWAQADQPTESAVSPTGLSLKRVWVTRGFDKPEGVAIAPDGGFFVSNISGDIATKDGVGWISRLDSDGAVLDAQWATGFDAPKGMVVLGDRLYVADIDTVRVINVETGQHVVDIDVPGAEFLNDAALWRGHVVISDSRNATIYVVNDQSAEVLVEFDQYGQLNGLLEGPDGSLLIASMQDGVLFSFDIMRQTQVLATGLNRPDGIGIAPDGSLLVSSFPGEIFHLQPSGPAFQLVDTRPSGVMQNDLSVFGDTVLVPNLEPGSVSGWRILYDD
ncbi:MAG: hypothetical protein AAFR65_08235 [Pseudomonadota bacterium]